MNDYYDILNVSKTATVSEIKQSFRKLSLLYHPDKNPNESSKYESIVAAYTTLSDYETRLQYDSNNSNNSSNNSNHNNINNNSNHIDSSNGNNNSNHTDSSNHSNSSSPIHTQRCQSLVKLPQNTVQNYKPQSININVYITLENAYNGCCYPIEIDRWIYEDGYKIMEHEKIYMDIEAGTDNGEIIILKHRGNIDIYDVCSDIKIHIHIKEHECFERNGLNLIYRKILTFEESLCGFLFKIPMLYDGSNLCIRNNNGEIILHGSKKTLKNKGMIRNKIVGNLIIEFIVTQPPNLTHEQLTHIKQMFQK